MKSMSRIVRSAGIVAALIAALGSVGLRQQGRPNSLASAGVAAPGSQQDFVVNVGDRVFFEIDSTELTTQSRATLDKQAQWLQQYANYTFTIEGHADERGTREYNIALGARRAQAVRDYLVARGIQPGAHAHGVLRQGAAGRGLQRHFVLVAEPPRRDGAGRHLLKALLTASRIACRRPEKAPVCFGDLSEKSRQSHFGPDPAGMLNPCRTTNEQP